MGGVERRFGVASVGLDRCEVDMTGDDLQSIIWRFRTRQGAVRLHLAAPTDQLPDLYVGLKATAITADSYDEFVRMASAMALDAGGMVGDVLRQPWAEGSFEKKVRAAALLPEIGAAVAAVLDAATAARADETAWFLESQEANPLRAYVCDLARGLDEHGDRFVADLASAFGVAVQQLVIALEGVD